MKTFLAAAALAVPLSLTTVAQAQRAHGIDVSHFQGNMNWDTAYNQGVRFAFVRASRGGTQSGPNPAGFLNDTEFADNVSLLRTQATRAVNPRSVYNGFYHYGRPDLIAVANTDTGLNQQPALQTIINSAKDEAAHFWNVVDQDMSLAGLDASRRLRPVLDLEERGGEDGPDAGTTPDTDALTPTNLSRWADEFLNEFQRLSSGIRPILYMNTNYATSFITSSLADEKLWVANWTDDPTGNPGDGVFPTWSFWQYSSAENHLGDEYGASVSEAADIDLNVANGDINFVRSFLIPEPGGAALMLCVGLGYLSTMRSRRPVARA
ncbi:MAG: glycoside hydrolase family 25 protein [Tepidisphaeraceae bacterium]